MKTTNPSFSAPVLFASVIGAFILGMLVLSFTNSGMFWFGGPTGMMRGYRGPVGSTGMMGHGVAITSDADFLMGMIPHHQEAVDTATFTLTKTQDPEMQEFLQGIIDAQTREIEQMKRWHQEWFEKEYVADQRYRAMMPNLTNLPDDQVIPAFLHGMIMHHIGAIDMARQILLITERPELRSFAQDIIRVQSNEIERMLGWLSARAGFMPMMMH